MYQTFQFLHSYWAYLVLAVVLIAVVNAVWKWTRRKTFKDRDLRIALFALIATHIQLLIGLITYFVSPLGFQIIQKNGMGGLSSLARQISVEHPFVGILSVVLITIGFSKHKKKIADIAKFKTIAIYYLLGLILLLSRIPYASWFS